VIFGGMISSLALTLIVLPVLYVLVNGRKEQVVGTMSASADGGRGCP
jgi:hypothetical protein